MQKGESGFSASYTISIFARVIDAPWRTPGADPGDFFNYGMRERSWKEYCAKVKQYQLEYTLQRRIQVYGREGGAAGHDADLPPELAAAMAQRRQEDTQRVRHRESFHLWKFLFDTPSLLGEESEKIPNSSWQQRGIKSAIHFRIDVLPGWR